MTSGTQQIKRVMMLTPYLQRNPGVTMEKAAADFGITPRQLRKDLSVAYMVGLPGLMPGDLVEIDMELVEDQGVIFLTNADFLARPLRFTPDEALALGVGLRAVRDIAPPESLPAIDSALAKLEQVAGDSAEASRRVEVRMPTADTTVREAIATARAAGARLRITYDSAARGETTVRLVDPHSVAMRDGYAYLEAWSDAPAGGGEPGWRSFRLDRIVQAEATEVAAGDHGEPPRAVGGWLDRVEGALPVTLDVAANAAWIAEYYPVESAEPLGGGTVRVRLRIASPGFLDALLLRLGGSVLAVDPLEAADGARRAAEEALAQYAALFGEDGAGS
ncbi:WYL domain-containing protein [Mariniluteicoccus endophyticus]